MAEWSANAVQTVQPGEAIVFTNNPVPATTDLIRWRDDTGLFNLQGWLPRRRRCCCCCCNNGNQSANYFADFGANIAVPTGQTVGEISVTFAVNGTVIPGTRMSTTPSAVEVFENVSRAANVPIWLGCCQTLTIVNTSTIPIEVQNANLVITRPEIDSLC